jgi:hypothetical protein
MVSITFLLNYLIFTCSNFNIKNEWREVRGCWKIVDWKEESSLGDWRLEKRQILDIGY